MDEHESEMFSHYYWYMTANRLKYSGEVLLKQLVVLLKRQKRKRLISLELKNKQRAIFESSMMITGFALENLIKGVAIKNYLLSGQEIKTFKQLAKDVWKTNDAHNTATIAQNSNHSFSVKELDLLKRYSLFTVWAGRYHIPKSKSAYSSVFSNQTLTRYRGDSAIIDEIFKRILGLEMVIIGM